MRNLTKYGEPQPANLGLLHTRYAFDRSEQWLRTDDMGLLSNRQLELTPAQVLGSPCLVQLPSREPAAQPGVVDP